MPTLTVYPSIDSAIQANSTTWSAVRSATSGTVTDETSTTFSIRGDQVSASDFRLSRGFLFLPTSSLGSGATINSATLKVTVAVSHPTNNSLGLVAGTPASTSAIDAGDFDQVGTTEFATRVSASSTGQKTFTLNSSGLNAINKTGVTVFAIRNAFDIDNSSPAGNNNGDPDLYAVEDGTLGNRPVLEIDYTPGTDGLLLTF